MDNGPHILIYGGLCNRLLAMSSLMNHPEFWKAKLYWEVWPGCQASYYELFQEPYVYWHKIQELEEVANWQQVPHDEYVDFTQYNYWKTNGMFSVGKRPDSPHERMQMLIQPAAKFVVQPYISEPINQMMDQWDDNVYGIHYREGIGINYNAPAMHMTNFDTFMDKIYCILNYDMNAKFFIATDTPNALNKFYKILRKRMIYVPTEFGPIDSGYTAEGMKRSVIDLFLLSKCKQIICSLYTTFPTIAALINGRFDSDNPYVLYRGDVSTNRDDVEKEAPVYS